MYKLILTFPDLNMIEGDRILPKIIVDSEVDPTSRYTCAAQQSITIDLEKFLQSIVDEGLPGAGKATLEIITTKKNEIK